MRRVGKVAVPIMVAVALSTACGQGAESQSEQDRRAEEYAKSLGVDVDVTSSGRGTPTVTVDRSIGGVAAQAGNNLAVPTGFPDDVPLYPEVNLAASSQMPGMGFMLQGHSDDGIEMVASFYASEMKARGWAQEGGQQTPSMRLIQFAKGARTATVTLIPAGRGTSVQLTAAP